MPPIFILLHVFIIALILNLVWEFTHAILYKTCLKMNIRDEAKLLYKMSTKDAILVTVFYVLSGVIFNNINPFIHLPQLFTFIGFTIVFAYFDERISIKKGRWKYAKDMPLLLKVGITPLVELAITGTITLAIIFSYVSI